MGLIGFPVVVTSFWWHWEDLYKKAEVLFGNKQSESASESCDLWKMVWVQDSIGALS